MEQVDRWKIVEELMAREEDVDDPNIPLMLWFGMEPLVRDDPQRALSLALGSQLPQLSQFIARRAIDGDAIKTVIHAVKEKSPNQIAMLEGMNEGLQGRSGLVAPESWKKVAASLSAKAATRGLAQSISQQFGDSEAAKAYLATALDHKAPAELRNEAIKALADKQWPELEPELPDLWEDPAVRIEAIRATAAYHDYGMGWQLLNTYDSYSSEEKLEVIQTLATRPHYGNVLNNALRSGRIAKSDVPIYVARQLRRVVGSGFIETWGPIDDLGSG